jgi:hypothetical protein
MNEERGQPRTNHINIEKTNRGVSSFKLRAAPRKKPDYLYSSSHLRASARFENTLVS